MPTKEARQEELYLRGGFFFKALPDAHLVIDEQCRIRHLNRKAREVFGYTHAEVDNQPLSFLFVDPAEIAAFVRTPATCRDIAVWVKRKSGSIRKAQASFGNCPGSHEAERRLIVRLLFR